MQTLSAHLTQFRFGVSSTLLRPSTLVVAGLVLVPTPIVMLIRLFNTGSFRPLEMFHLVMGVGFFLVILPILSLFFGTSMISREADKRTLIYLITRRLGRSTFFANRYLATGVSVTLLIWIGVLALYAACFFGTPPVAESSLRGQSLFAILGIYFWITFLAVLANLSLYSVIALTLPRPSAIASGYWVSIEFIVAVSALPIRKLPLLHRVYSELWNRIPSWRSLEAFNPRNVDFQLYSEGSHGLYGLLIVATVGFLYSLFVFSKFEIKPQHGDRE